MIIVICTRINLRINSNKSLLTSVLYVFVNIYWAKNISLTLLLPDFFNNTVIIGKKRYRINTINKIIPCAVMFHGILVYVQFI